MLLHQEFVQVGNWLFRWRSYVPLALLSVLLIALLQFSYPYQSHTLDTVYDFACFGVALLGLGIRVVTVGFVPHGTSGRNTRGQTAARLNTTGTYSIVRHPLYLGNFLIWLGVSLFPREWWCSAIVMLSFLLFYERIVFAAIV